VAVTSTPANVHGNLRVAGRRRLAAQVVLIAMLLPWVAGVALAQVKPGDFVNPQNAGKVAGLVSPGNLILVRQGMTMNIVPSGQLDWPNPYKAATEKYSMQVRLTSDGELANYVAGLPFPLLDPNDPKIGLKIMWNFSYRPLYTDDIDIREAEVESRTKNPAVSDSIERFTAGHVALYNNIDRNEVPPTPIDPDYERSGIRYRFAIYPMLEPSEMRGAGFLRYRHADPNVEDNAWVYNSFSRKVRRVAADSLADTIENGGSDSGAGPATSYANTLDPDTYFGFAAKIEDFEYKLLGVKRMLACVEAANSPEHACPTDGGRTVCPENWEMRYLYVIEATAKPTSRFGSPSSIPKRILYIDSEGWFVTASDLYDRDGQLWKTVATFNAYRDRPTPDAQQTVWPFKRMFQTALVDEDIRTGFSTILYTPSRDTDFADTWFINQGQITPLMLEPSNIVRLGH
jgi:hypothetical protein